MSGLIEEIKKDLKSNISSKRYNHIIGVMEAAIYLADKYDEDIEKVTIAALLHDYAKDFSQQQLKEYILQHNIVVDHILMEAYQLLHGKVAAHIANTKYHINDQEVLNAIENHTTGNLNMSKVEKIIYLADFIEVGRNYPGVEELRLVAEESLDRGVLMALENTIVYVLSIGKLLHPNTVYARNQLLLDVK